MLRGRHDPMISMPNPAPTACRPDPPVHMNSPTSVAHVTSHLTISRRRQLSVDRVMRITCKANLG